MDVTKKMTVLVRDLKLGDILVGGMLDGYTVTELTQPIKNAIHPGERQYIIEVKSLSGMEGSPTYNSARLTFWGGFGPLQVVREEKPKETHAFPESRELRAIIEDIKKTAGDAPVMTRHSVNRKIFELLDRLAHYVGDHQHVYHVGGDCAARRTSAPSQSQGHWWGPEGDFPQRGDDDD